MLRRRFLHVSGAAALMPTLGACVAVAPLAPPSQPEVRAVDYGARIDGGHRIAAVDLDQIPAFLHRQVVPYVSDRPEGSVIIENANRLLHLILPGGFALRYGISVGREGFGWSGNSTVYRKARWPVWTPPPEMIARDPQLERWSDGQPGGPTNPLGARALYLMSDGRDHGYRIHGTPEWRSVGQFASSGCFRMLQHDVIDLYDYVQIGTEVVVI